MATFQIVGLEDFAKRVCSIDGTTGEIPPGYVRVRGGPNLAKARSIGRNIQRPNDPDTLVREVYQMIAAAHTQHRVFCIEWVAKGDTSESDNTPPHYSDEYQPEQNALVVPEIEVSEKSPASGALAVVAIHQLRSSDIKDRKIEALNDEIRQLDMQLARAEFRIEMLNSGTSAIKWREAKEMVGMTLKEAMPQLPGLYKIVSEYVEVMRVEAVAKAAKAGATDTAKDTKTAGQTPEGETAEATLDACIAIVVKIFGEHPEFYTFERAMAMAPIANGFSKAKEQSGK